MTRLERMAARADKREQWAAGAKRAAASRFNAADRAVDGIPFGQPILVGHHSERRHRAALDRCDTNMRAGFERQEMAQHHAAVADTLRDRLETNIFSDDDDAIQQLEARIAEREAKCARVVELNKAIRRELKAGNGVLLAGALDRIGATAEERTAIQGNARYGGTPLYPGYTNGNMRNLIRADRERIESIKRETARRKLAVDNGGVSVQKFPDNNWCQVTFAEKPSRAILDALHAAGYGYSRGTWCGYLNKFPLSDAGEIPQAGDCKGEVRS